MARNLSLFLTQAVRSEIERALAGQAGANARPETPVSDWLERFDVEETGQLWLTGVLLGYPLWTTVARYHAQ